MACACAITGGELLLSGARAEHLRSLLFKLSEAGIHIKDTPGGLMVFGRAKQPFEIRTMVYPGFPTGFAGADDGRRLQNPRHKRISGNDF